MLSMRIGAFNAYRSIVLARSFQFRYWVVKEPTMIFENGRLNNVPLTECQRRTKTTSITVSQSAERC